MKTKKISTPLGILLILLAALLVGVLVWQCYLVPEYGVPPIKIPSRPSAKVTITTDKTEYVQGEKVKITITNNLDYSVTPSVVNLVKPDRSFGENYGIGLIEKFEDDKWVAIEPVWRCKSEFSSCFAECLVVHVFKPYEKRVFEWEQTVRICNITDRTEKVENAGAGKYRVSSNVWFTKEQTYKTIYSNEFTIK